MVVRIAFIVNDKDIVEMFQAMDLADYILMHMI